MRPNLPTWRRRAPVLLQLILCVLILPQLSRAQPSTRPRVGLVLSGGGALGFAHVGVIKVLEENRIPVDFVTGTSMGSIVGAAYASGASVAEMEHMSTATDWNALFSEKVPRRELPLRFKSGRNREIFGDVKIGLGPKGIIMPAGFVQGQDVLPLFQELYRNVPSPVDFDKLPLPFRAVAADIETGQAVVPASGDLPTVVRASMSVPAAFNPVELGGRVLVDGGIVNNFPIDLARELGAEVVIAVDLKTNLKKKDELTDPFSIGGQILSLLLEQNTAAQVKTLKPSDIYIVADTSAYSATSFNEGAKILAIGEAAARSALDRLRTLQVSAEEYEAWQRRRTTPLSVDEGTIAAVNVVNDRADRPCLELLAREGVKLLALRCTGFNNVDLAAAKALKLAVTRVPNYSPYSVAEHAVALVLALNRKIHRAYNRVRELNFSLGGLVGYDLHGKTAGIVGTGKIGKIVAEILRGFGMKVVAYDPYPAREWAERLGVEYVDPRGLARESDVVSLHIPLTPETKHIIRAETIEVMKRGAILVNVSRGALIDTAALIQALKSGRLGGVALDVYEEEEGIFFQDLSGQILHDDDLARLLTFPNVLITAHQAFLTEEALNDISNFTVSNLEALASRKPFMEGSLLS